MIALSHGVFFLLLPVGEGVTAYLDDVGVQY